MKPLTFIKRWLVVCLCMGLAQVFAFGGGPAGNATSDVGKDGQGRETPGARAHKPMEIGVRGGVQGLGITYSFALDKSNNFHSISAFLDYWDVTIGQQSNPGGFFRYDYHFSLVNSSRWLLYAGPGAMAGYVSDRSQPHGVVLGLCGNFGAKYLFERNLSLGVSIHPILGFQFNRVDGHIKQNLYESGLWRTILPEISIGYCFGNQTVSSEESTSFRPAGQMRHRPWTLGIEFSYKPLQYNYLVSMYQSEDASRNYSEESVFAWQNQASIYLSAAWHFTEFYQLRFLLGYAGIRPDVRLHEVLLRNQWNFKPLNIQGDRLFAAVDAGCGLKSKDLSKPYALLNLSFGYSLAMSADSNLEFFIRSENCYGSPTMYEYDDGQPVPPERAYKSRFFVSSIAFGIALDL